ncbi:hypothetical protein QR685DRAFT_573625 [Neurospora intermedia]|uniref:Uncharacterized protein n=1 Tax=Neurospora intermedia TaxID=5142 RepID=A0ABR3D6M2_NEUIN
MNQMMRELVATSDPLEGHASVPLTYTSVLSSEMYNDERHRHWFVACRIAETHFGLSLPDPLQPSDGASVTAAQATAADKIHECYVEGLEDTMMRFYNLGFSRVSTATHRYALDFSLWMRGTFAGYFLYVGCGDYGPQFWYTKPLDYVAPFSQEYDDFYRHRRAQEAIPKPVASTITTSDMPHHEPQEAPPKLAASIVTNDSMPHYRRVTVADFDELLREDRERAREEKERTNPESSGSQAHSTSTAELSRGINKRSLDEAETMALAPPPKRPQTGFPQRTLTSMGMLGCHEVHQHSQVEQHSQVQSITAQTGNESHRPQSSSQASRGHPRFSARVCGNRRCESRHHELADCLGPPSRQGDIDGCPLCNTQQHGLDCCAKLPRIPRNDLFDILVTRRANLTVIRTSISILSLAASLNKLVVLAEAMPLTKGTAKGIYTQHQPLDQAWSSVIMGTVQNNGPPENIPRNLTVFNSVWISQLVPFRKAFAQAGVHVDGRGYYPFGTAPQQRAYEKAHQEKVHQELYTLRRERAASQVRRR